MIVKVRATRVRKLLNTMLRDSVVNGKGVRTGRVVRRRVKVTGHAFGYLTTLKKRVSPPVPNEELWAPRGRTAMRVGDMDERHVRNALRMVIRKRREARQRIIAVQTALNELTGSRSGITSTDWPDEEGDWNGD